MFNSPDKVHKMGQEVLKLDAAVLILGHLLFDNILHVKDDPSGDGHFVRRKADLERQSHFTII